MRGPDAADPIRWEAEIEQAAPVRVRERDDHVEAQEARLQEEVVQGVVRLIRRCGHGEWRLSQGRAEPRHRRAVVVDEVDRIGSEFGGAPADRPDDPRERDRLARVVIRAGKAPVVRVEARIGAQVDRDRRDATEGEPLIREVLDGDGQNLEFVA